MNHLYTIQTLALSNKTRVNLCSNHQIDKDVTRKMSDYNVNPNIYSAMAASTGVQNYLNDQRMYAETNSIVSNTNGCGSDHCAPKLSPSETMYIKNLDRAKFAREKALMKESISENIRWIKQAAKVCSVINF